MPTCDNCSEHVTEQYQRVFAANDGTLHGCPACRAQSEMLDGAGAKPDE